MKYNSFAILVSRFNQEITDGLLQGAVNTLVEKGFTPHDIDVFYAPGAFEIPLIAKKLAQTKKYKGVICLGAVIKGDTAHFEFISLGAATGLMQSMLETEVPLSFGILTTYTEEQALARSRTDAHNKGREAALACWETSLMLRNISAYQTNS